MIWAFFAKELLGLARGWWLLIIATVIAALVLIANHWLDGLIETATATGAVAQREGDLRETIQRTETAHAARDEVRDLHSPAAYDQCLRTARTPANCQRFLPVE